MKKIIYINAIFVLIMTMSISCIDDFRFGDTALDKPAGVDMNLDTIYSKAELARRHLWSLYWYVPCPVPTWGGIDMNADWYEGLSDCIHSILGWGWLNEAWYEGAAGPANYRDRWFYSSRGGGYEGIRIGWTFIENVDRVPDMSTEEKARLKAEAKVIIAGKYWEFFRHYGGVPIVDKVYNSEDPAETERATIEEMYNFMIKLLDEAIAEPNLPWVLPQSENSEWWGRITKGAAYAQKMLVQLHAASPIYNDDVPYYTENPNHEAITKKYVWWGGYNSKLWDDLKATCEEFMRLNIAAGEPYRMVQPTARTEDGYMMAYRNAYYNRADFYSDVKGTYEIVYPFIDRAQAGYSWWDRFFAYSSYQNAWGQQAPTGEFMEMFGWANGQVFDTTGIYIHEFTPSIPLLVTDTYDVPAAVKNRPPRADNYYIYDNRDPRLYEMLWVQKRGRTWWTSPVEIWPKGNAIAKWPDGFAHGISNHKWVFNQDGSSNQRDRQYCWPVFRMAAFHLIYAEALAETGNLQAACDEINKVRARVGIPAIETSNPQLNLTSNKANLIKQILRERACEFGYEDTRFMDMVRRKLKDDFTKPLHGIWTYRVDGKQGSLADGEAYPELWYSKVTITRAKQRAWWKEGAWSNKMYLNFFPQGEVLKGYGLVQNPGW